MLAQGEMSVFNCSGNSLFWEDRLTFTLPKLRLVGVFGVRGMVGLQSLTFDTRMRVISLRVVSLRCGGHNDLLHAKTAAPISKRKPARHKY